jgi:hypothetical protein
MEETVPIYTFAPSVYKAVAEIISNLRHNETCQPYTYELAQKHLMNALKRIEAPVPEEHSANELSKKVWNQTNKFYCYHQVKMASGCLANMLIDKKGEAFPKDIKEELTNLFNAIKEGNCKSSLMQAIKAGDCKSSLRQAIKKGDYKSPVGRAINIITQDIRYNPHRVNMSGIPKPELVPLTENGVAPSTSVKERIKALSGHNTGRVL